MGIISFIFANRYYKIQAFFYGLLPTILYEIYYVINILITMKNGRVSLENDWYYFAQNGLLRAILVAPAMLGITFCLSLIIWRLNKKK